jgi:hypothetical protein
MLSIFLSIISVLFSSSSVSSLSIKKSVDVVKPLSISIGDGQVKLKTGVIRFEKVISVEDIKLNLYSNENLSKRFPRFFRINADLVSMIHIGDRSYYEKISNMLNKSDPNVVLYELITNDANTVIEGNDYMIVNQFEHLFFTKTISFNIGFKRRLSAQIYSPESQALARQFNLTTQVESFDFSKNNWFIADVESERLRRIETGRSFLH